MLLTTVATMGGVVAMGSAVRFALVGAVALLVAGCSGDGGAPFGSAFTSPVETGRSDSPGDGPRNGAPKVDDPLDVDRVVDEPCAGLGADQLRELGFHGPGELNTVGRDDGCDWYTDGSRMHSVTIRPLASDKDGLGDAYHRRDDYAYFEATTIGGYPAAYGSMMDLRDDGNCTLQVGVTDELAIEVTTFFLDVEPCPMAGRTAEAMVEHIKDGA
jgi:hypothetical protein